jgi:transcriptional regulator with XRE-family HTH domain
LREIARRLGISRNTVRRYIRAETIEPAYADRRPRSSLDKYTLKLSAWLKTEAAKSRKQRRTLKQLHLALRALGYDGSYDRVAAFARRWKVDQLERVNSARKSTIIHHRDRQARNSRSSTNVEPVRDNRRWLFFSHNSLEFSSKL